MQKVWFTRRVYGMFAIARRHPVLFARMYHV